ncbi:MAG: [Fe-Fe] hydrogenase large subunit C-terminal domain-containing protein [Faecalibacterium sp.]
MGAIIDFKATKCKHCYKCVRYCEVKAIMIKDGKAEIMPDQCILCGLCLQICPQSAKSLNSDISLVKGMIARGEKVVVSLAPSYKGILPFSHKGQVKDALQQLGFSDVRETAEGAALVTNEYADLLATSTLDNIITTCCPSANALIEKHYPTLVPYLAPVVSPMVAHGRLIKKELGTDTKVVFLGPCIAKKQESIDPRHDDAIDAVLNFTEVQAWLASEQIEISACQDKPFAQTDPKVNRLYPVTNGVIHSILATQSAPDHYRKFYVHGERNCIDLCESMLRGEVSGCFIEMNICQGGCVSGPALDASATSRFKVKLDLEDSIPKEGVSAAQIDKMKTGVAMQKVFTNRAKDSSMPTENQIRDILCKTNKFTPEDELNCGACGYATCREKAIAVFQDKAELNMCIPFMTQKAESLANLVMETSPNVVMIVDDTLKILEYSAVGEKYFGKTRTEALQMYLYELIDPTDFEWVLKTHQSIRGKKISFAEYHTDMLQNIMYIEKENVVLSIFIDITKEEEIARLDFEKKLETIELAQEVIRKQMMVAQEIAGLLGETTAETKTTLTSLCRSLLDEGNKDGGR